MIQQHKSTTPNPKIDKEFQLGWNYFFFLLGVSLNFSQIFKVLNIFKLLIMVFFIDS